MIAKSTLLVFGSVCLSVVVILGLLVNSTNFETQESKLQPSRRLMPSMPTSDPNAGTLLELKYS